MRANSSATIERGGRITHLASTPPLTLRQVYADDPAHAALCLVGTAAGPLAGDVLDLAIDVADGAYATLTAAGASIVQGRGGAPAELHTRVTVGAGACLRADPGPLIVCAGARADVHVEIALDATATLDWRELLVLGRAGEAPGAITLHWDVRRAGRPLLRQTIELVDPDLVSWPGMLRGRRVLASALLTGPRLAARTVVRTPTAVAQRVDEHCALVTALAHDAAEAEDELRQLLAMLRE